MEHSSDNTPQTNDEQHMKELNNEKEPTDEPPEMSTESSATAEGYSPILAAPGLSSTTQICMTTAEGPSSNGAFFADFSAFYPNNDSDSDEDSVAGAKNEEGYTVLFDAEAASDDDDDDDNAYSTTLPSKDDDNAANENDNAAQFRSIADKALLTLEDDYCRTIGQPMTTTQMQSIGNDTTHAAADEDDDEPLPPLILKSEINGTADNADSSEPFVADFGPDVIAADQPAIDTQAVRQAMKSIRLRDPDLEERFSCWEQSQPKHDGNDSSAQQASVPRVHAIIPTSILHHFQHKKSSAKSIGASHTNSRSATISAALIRLDLLQSQERLVIDVLGCDDVECRDDDTIRSFFGPLVQWLAWGAECPRHIELNLVGPNVPVRRGNTTTGLTLDIPAESPIDRPIRLESATVHCYTEVYSDFVASEQQRHQIGRREVDLAIAFNAGIWGYAEWKPTLQAVAKRRQGIPFIATAYTLLECEEDQVIFQEVQTEYQTSADSTEESSATPGIRCLWEPELNPFGSRKVRKTASAAPGQVYRENAAWQAWSM